MNNILRSSAALKYFFVF